MAMNIQEFCEPYQLSQWSFEWMVKPLCRNTQNVEYYVISEAQNGMRLYAEVNRQEQTILIKNMYGETLFKGLSHFDINQYLSVTFADGTELGEIRKDILMDKTNDEDYRCLCYEPGKNYFLYGPFPTTASSTMSDTSHLFYLSITIEGNKLTTNKASTINPVDNNIAKGLIMMKTLQLIVNTYYLPICVAPYLQVPIYATSILNAVTPLSEVKLINQRIMRGHLWYHYLTSNGPARSCQLKLYFESIWDGNLEVIDTDGAYQFHAFNLKNMEDVLTVAIHKMIFIGYVANRTFKNHQNESIMEVRNLIAAEDLSFNVVNLNGVVVCKVNTDECGVNISMDPKISSEYKALLLAYTYKMAYHLHAFQSISGRTADNPAREPFLPFEGDSINQPCQGFHVSLLSNNLTLKKAGHDPSRAITYVKVFDDPTKTNVVVFEVVELAEKISATAFNCNGCLLFSVSGIWDMATDMVVNSEYVIGLLRQGVFYDCSGDKLMSVHQTVEETTSENGKTVCRTIHSLYDFHYDVTDFTMRELVAVIRGEDDNVFIEVADEDILAPEWKALIISYALKVAYNDCQMYKKSMPAITNVCNNQDL